MKEVLKKEDVMKVLDMLAKHEFDIKKVCNICRVCEMAFTSIVNHLEYYKHIYEDRKYCYMNSYINGVECYVMNNDVTLEDYFLTHKQSYKKYITYKRILGM